MRYIVGTFNTRESLVAVSGKRPIPPTHFLFQHTLTKEKLSQVSKQGFFVNNYINDPFVNSYLIKTTYSEKLNTPYKIFCPPPSLSPKMTKFNFWYFFFITYKLLSMMDISDIRPIDLQTKISCFENFRRSYLYFRGIVGV